MVSPVVVWRNRGKDRQLLGKVGEITSVSKICHPPQGFGSDPYYVAVVDFRNGRKKTGQLVREGGEPRIGAKVEAALRILGQPGPEEVINYGLKFRLI